MTITDTSTPVVVLTSPHHGGLGVTRSLGRLGIPVFNVDSTRWAPALSSRYCRGKFVWDLDTVPPEKSVEYLLDVARQVGRRSILIPTTDSAATFVADHAAELGASYIFPAPSSTLVHSLCNKRELYGLARRFGIPTPKTVCPETRAGLLQCLEHAELPIILKGTGGEFRKLFSKTKLIVRTRQQLVELHDAIAEATFPNLVVQEYIPGGEDTVWMFNGYFNERSECLVGFTGRKLRQCPVYTGVTSLGVCEKNEVVEATARKFMKEVGYQGMLDVDFRYDARDGQYKVLDVNPRIGSTFRLFVSDCGLDVARAFYLDLTGQPWTPAQAPDGRKWIAEDLDVAAAFRYFQDGNLRFPDWLKSLRGIRESAFLAADDPLPTLLMLRADINELWRRTRLRRETLAPFEYKKSPA